MTENAVSLKLPTFWTSQPEVWFAQAEAQFHIRSITADATRYYYVVSALDQSTAGRLLDVLQSPPAEDKYEHLKQQLLRTFGLTRRDRAARLLDMASLSLGDRKPSEILADMRSLASGHACMLFEEVFLQQMPDDIRMQMAQQDFSDLDAVAERADALWQSKSQRCEPAALSINKIAKPKHIKQPTRTTTDPDTISSDGWCFYHTKFGNKAKKCNLPCSFPGNASATRQ